MPILMDEAETPDTSKGSRGPGLPRNLQRSKKPSRTRTDPTTCKDPSRSNTPSPSTLSTTKMDFSTVLFAVIFLACLSDRATSSEDRVRSLFRREHVLRKRSYYPWANNVIAAPQFDSLSVYKPPIYQLTRPYYIPVFGVPGRIPIYFPPQPIYQGPTYLPPLLPPTTSTTTPKPAVNMTFGNRDGVLDYDDAPVWGVEPSNTGGSSVRLTTPRPQEMRPTRFPPPKEPSTFPPLVHNGGTTRRTTTLPPRVQHLRPQDNIVQAEAAPQASSPGPCVWAIISCCSASSNQIRYSCFEQRGCMGAFWDVSPCEGDFAKAAIASALNYYNSK